MTLEQRYHDVLRRFDAATLLDLPERIKEILKNTSDLETKVKMLEAIADIMKR